MVLAEQADTRRSSARYEIESIKREAKSRLVSAEELAAEWGVRRPHIYTLIHTKVLPHVRIGKRIFVVRAVADKYIDKLSASVSATRA